MSQHDAMDALTGIAVLLALVLFASAWTQTFTEWESTWASACGTIRGQGSRPGTFAHYRRLNETLSGTLERAGQATAGGSRR
jgi:hypothetical protein